MASYNIARISVTQWRSWRFHIIQYFPARYVGLRWNHDTYSFMVMVYKVLRRNMLQIKPGTPGRIPFLFDKYIGFYARYKTHTGPAALGPIRRTKHHGSV